MAPGGNMFEQQITAGRLLKLPQQYNDNFFRFEAKHRKLCNLQEQCSHGGSMFPYVCEDQRNVVRVCANRTGAQYAKTEGPNDWISCNEEQRCGCRTTLANTSRSAKCL